ncbi:MAG: HAMP domain-containing histidine kinase [Verrucomicrobia bacterium]|nr:HAMP domain-containing histidine kinase [Verrucomicrobiota bacterium]
MTREPKPRRDPGATLWRVPLLVLGVALVILAGAIFATTWQVRARIREQIVGRDGEVLHAVALVEYAGDVAEGFAGPISDPGNQLNVVLRTSQLKGVIGVQLFDAAGRFVESFPPDLGDGRLDPRDLFPLQHLKPAGHFHPAVRMSGVFFSLSNAPSASEPTVPLLEVNVPLHTADAPLAGIARFLIEGQSIAAEYARLDRHLAAQAAGAFVAGGGLLSVALWWAFRRLRRAHGLLAERTEHLVKANQELALAAKTSALGAVTAHLLHDLKNPLAGLQSFVTAHSAEQTGGSEPDWESAVASTRRMQSLVNQVITVLREDQTGVRYEITLPELGEIVSGRVLPLAREKGVALHCEWQGQASLPNRAAHLTALILVNLAHNAVQATPAGKSVRLSAQRVAGHIVFEVRDEGPGFPASQTPFVPCRSDKEGGGGIGLALSKQLAQHLGATLELRSNAPSGCVFALALPAGL